MNLVTMKSRTARRPSCLRGSRSSGTRRAAHGCPATLPCGTAPCPSRSAHCAARSRSDQAKRCRGGGLLAEPALPQPHFGARRRSRTAVGRMAAGCSERISDDAASPNISAQPRSATSVARRSAAPSSPLARAEPNCIFEAPFTVSLQSTVTDPRSVLCSTTSDDHPRTELFVEHGVKVGRSP